MCICMVVHAMLCRHMQSTERVVGNTTEDIRRAMHSELNDVGAVEVYDHVPQFQNRTSANLYPGPAKDTDKRVNRPSVETPAGIK